MSNLARDYLIQRASALIMAPLVLVHLTLVIYAVRDGMTASDILARTQGSFGWAVFYTIFVLAAVSHADVGVRNVLIEWSPLSKSTATLLAHAFAVLTLVLGLRAVYAVVA